jgi:hypothetical protein
MLSSLEARGELIMYDLSKMREKVLLTGSDRPCKSDGRAIPCILEVFRAGPIKRLGGYMSTKSHTSAKKSARTPFTPEVSRMLDEREAAMKRGEIVEVDLNQLRLQIRDRKSALKRHRS